QLLRILFATRTVLFIGFSFTDDYIRLLRDEVLSLLGNHRDQHPIAYALMDDVPIEQAAFHREYMGLGILNYDTDGKKDFSGFDQLLEAIHAETNPRSRLGRLLVPEGQPARRILWYDPAPGNNRFGIESLAKADPRAVVKQTFSLEDTQAELEKSEHSYDLVISRWGYRPATPDLTDAEALLDWMHQHAVHVPLIVFAT